MPSLPNSNNPRTECPGYGPSPLTRREMLRYASNGFGMLALSSLMADDAYAGLSGDLRPHHAPKAKNIIFCYMPGAVSHVDTFDPKPKLDELDGQNQTPDGSRKWKKCPWEFHRYGESGTPVSDVFPHIATCVDEMAVIRSMKTGFPLHPRGNLLMHTGRSVGGHPSLGSWINYGLGSENRNLPGYVLLHGGTIPPGGLESFSNGYLPATHQAMPIRAEGAPIDNIVPADKNTRVQRAKLDVLLQQDRHYLRTLGSQDGVESAIHNYELAYRMQSLVPDVLNLDRESKATKRLYGLETKDKNKHLYSQQCLRARRLVEAGVRFVEVTCPDLFGGNNGTWDQHTELKKGHEGNALVTDQAVAALIKDLRSRGMLEETLVVWGTEFGRTPHTGNVHGRDHHETAYSVWLAGAGIKGGTVHGATDDVGMHSVEDICEPHDLHATILHLFGLDHERLTYRFGGRDVSLTDVHGRVIEAVLS